MVRTAEAALSDRGYSVTRNTPYSGGFVTRHYGRPSEGVHSLQIEINRALYMDEAKIEHADNFSQVAADMSAVLEALAAIDPATLRT